MSRSLYGYRSVARDSSALLARIKEIAATRVHYGYRRVHVMLQREGWKSLSAFLWARRLKRRYPRACVNRSPNRIANWFMADFQSKAARTDLASTLRNASQSSLMAASSLGK